MVSKEPYRAGFKARMVKRMAGPEGISATALSEEVGVPQSTLSRWLRAAATVASMDGSQGDGGGKARRPQDWSADQKLRVVAEASTLSEAELGEFLRRKGLHTAQLEEWRAAAAQALGKAPKARRGQKSQETKRIKALERELDRKDKALAEVTALLVLKKKLETIWGGEDESTPTRTET